MADNWFSYDPCEGLLFWPTAEEARKEAQAALDAERDSAPDGGWSEEVEVICWGRIYGKVIETDRKPAEEGAGCDEWVEYELMDPLDPSSTGCATAEVQGALRTEAVRIEEAQR